MIRVEKLSYGFPAKDLYHDISFTLETGQHCALIGSNGTGKSTLADMLMDPEKYLYDGKIVRDENCRIGYASQFSVRDKSQECTVFEYLARRFTELEQEIAAVCGEMAAPEAEEKMETLFAQYQQLLDQSEAMDADHYESNIHRQLHTAGMEHLAETRISEISGGEYKLLQIMREMLLAPNLLILDEPDVFLDFENLGGLAQLMNAYKGTLLAVTHNRYLLNHCFQKILHLESGDLQEFEGSYGAYRCFILREKLELRIQNLEEQEEIARTEEMVEILRKRATLMVNPTIGRSVNAKQSQLDRLLARQIKPPFIEDREPRIQFPQVDRDRDAEETALEAEPATVLQVTDYETSFDQELLRDVNFEIREGEKVAIVGANGTGKTTLLRDILKGENPALKINEKSRMACLSQLEGGVKGPEERTVLQVMQDAGMQRREEIRDYLAKYALSEELLDQKVSLLSGGEQNLLQIGLIGLSEADFLILDEPTSHLDLYAQTALEKAVAEYKGTVLMVSHDFYLVGNCADYVLLVENNTMRRMRTRNFRKMVYEKYFDQKYLEADRKKQELEAEITRAFRRDDLTAVDKLCSELEAWNRQ